MSYLHKGLQIASGIVLAIVLSAAAGVCFLLYVVDDRTYLGLVTEALRDSSGLDLKVEGSFALDRSLPPGISAEYASIIDNSNQSPFQSLTARRLNLRIALLPLLSRDIRFSLELQNPVIRLGDSRISSIPAKPDAATDSGWELDIGRVTVRDGLIERSSNDGDLESLITINNLQFLHDRGTGLATATATGKFRGSDYSVESKMTVRTLDKPIQLRLAVNYGQVQEAAFDNNKLSLRAAGEFTAVGSKKLNLDLEGHLPNLSQLAWFTHLDPVLLEKLGPFDIDGKVGFVDGSYEMQDLFLRWDSGKISFDADIPVEGEPFLRADVACTLPEFSRLLDVTGVEANALRDLGRLQASGSIVYQEGVYRVDELNLSRSDGILDLAISGRLSHEVDLALRAHSADGDKLAKLLQAPSWMSAPFPIDANARIRYENGSYHLPQFQIAWGSKGSAGRLSGNIPPQVQMSGKPSRLKLSADTLDILPLTMALPQIGPFFIQTDAYLTEENLRLTEIAAKLGGSDVSGSFDTGFEKPPRLKAELHSGFLDVDALIQAMKETASPAAGIYSESADNDDIFARRLDFSWLRALNGRLDLDVEKLKRQDRALQDFAFTAQIENGLLDLQLTGIDSGNGHFAMTGRIDSRRSPARINYHEDSKNVEISDWLELPKGIIEGGKSQASITLQTEGGTIAEMLAALNGDFLLEMGPARILEMGLASLSQSVFSSIVRGAFQAGEGREFTDYQCGVFGIDIDKGVALMDNSLSLQSEGYTLAGNGRIDLRDGTIDLLMRPRARKGLGFSAATLTGGFRISGQLDALEAGLSMGGLFGSYVANGIVASLATTPAGTVTTSSIIALRGIWDRIRSGSFKCEETLKRIKRRRNAGAKR